MMCTNIEVQDVKIVNEARGIANFNKILIWLKFDYFIF